MPHREFRDEDGREWEVWDVHPSNVEPSTDATTSEALIALSGDLASATRRTRRLSRLNLPMELRGGWLAFKTDGEARRLAPIPSSWVALADRDLALLVHAATPISRISPRS